MITSFLARSMRRRSFFQLAGATAATSALVLTGCGKDDPTPPAGANPNVLTLPAGDVGLLNYAYLLEQLEAAFYQKVLDAKLTDLLPGELAALTDLRDHEVIHREFFKFALLDNAIPTLVFDFSSISFTSRLNVLTAAKKFEDLGVAAYNGVGKLVSSSAYLVLLAKIASVEARHAAFIRDALQPNSLATPDATIIATAGDSTGFNIALTPREVLAAAAPFLPFAVDASQLPTS
ncbi:ferritin-like domain-containing protein [Hymenobacter fastidiosus]